MKKIIGVASVGLLALSIFGCKKKTTKNTTKDNTTITTKQNTSSNTTNKTTARKTTTENKEEFKEVNYATIKGNVDALPTNGGNYKKVTINGSITNSDYSEDKTFTDYVYMLNRVDSFVAADGGCTELTPYVLGTELMKHIPNEANFKFFMNANGEFKIEQYTKLYIEGKCATIHYTFDKFGYITKIETKDIVDDTTEIDQYNAVKNLSFVWETTDTFDDYTLITLTEAQEIMDSYAEQTKYIGAYITGSFTEKYTGRSYSLDHVASHYNSSTDTYIPYNTTLITDIHSEFNSYKASYLCGGNNTFFYKNDDNELAAIIYRKDYESELRTIRKVKFNDCGWAKELSDELVKDDVATDPFTISNYSVEFLTEEPTITITLNAGLGTFTNNRKRIDIVTTPGKSLSNLESVEGFETPTLDGAGYAYTFRWVDESNKVFDYGRAIYDSKSFTYAFIDSDFTSVPVASLTYDSSSVGTTHVADIKVEYYDNENKGIIVIAGSDIYYSQYSEIVFMLNGTTNVTIWGAFKSFSFSGEEGVYSEGNNFITNIGCLRPIEIRDYAFANLTNLQYFQQGTYSEMDYSIGDYAFYNCSSLIQFSTSRMAPQSIGKYAFAKTNLGASQGRDNGPLYDAPIVKEGAFSDIPELKYIVRNIVMDYDEETNTYTVNDKTYSYTNWEEGWNGTSGNMPKVAVLMDFAKFDEGQKLVITSKDAALSTLAVILYKAKTYYVQIDLEAGNDSFVSFRQLGSSTTYMNATGTITVTKTEFHYSSDNYYEYFAFTILNKFTEDQKLTITIRENAE